MYSIENKQKGTIYGQAIGDALGLGTEFMNYGFMRLAYPNGLRYYDEIFQDMHRSRWQKGAWTDDTDMMLCIAKAIVEDRKVNLSSIARNFKDWFCGIPMGIGDNTYKVLAAGDYVMKPLEVSKLIWEMSGRRSAANGGLMRTSVVGLLPKDVEDSAAAICRLTHYDPRCVGSCVIASEIIHSLVYKNVSPTYEQIVKWGSKYDDRIKEYVDLSLNDDIDELKLQDDKSMGYTLRTLAAGLWTYWHAKTFEEGLLAVVNAGGDADTNAAVACAILGAKFGFNAIPKEYVEGLRNKEQLEGIVQGMANLMRAEV